MRDLRIALLGLGQMARALAGGWVEAGAVSGDRIVGFDPSDRAVEQFTSAVPRVKIHHSNREAVADAAIVVLAVKPNRIEQVALEIQPHLTPDHLVVSIAAGVTLASLITALQTERVVRVMPNTPCLVGCGAMAYAKAREVTEEDEETVNRLLKTVGLVFAVPESSLDAVTGLSGSGPAYLYLMIEALSDGGVRAGLARDVATALAAQTVLGAARMVLETGEHPAVLKERVSSPGGTTIAGLEVLEQQGVRAACMAAVRAATDRSIELRGQATEGKR